MWRKAFARDSTTWSTGALARREKYLTSYATNMAYLVEFAGRAVRDLEVLYVEKNAASSPAAARWYNGLEQAVRALGSHPRRSPVIPEVQRLKRPLRHL